MNAIVIAWVRLDGAERTDELYRYDGVNWKRKWRTVPKGHTAVGVNKAQQRSGMRSWRTWGDSWV